MKTKHYIAPYMLKILKQPHFASYVYFPSKLLVLLKIQPKQSYVIHL